MSVTLEKRSLNPKLVYDIRSNGLAIAQKLFTPQTAEAAFSEEFIQQYFQRPKIPELGSENVQVYKPNHKPFKGSVLDLIVDRIDKGTNMIFPGVFSEQASKPSISFIEFSRHARRSWDVPYGHIASLAILGGAANLSVAGDTRIDSANLSVGSTAYIAEPLYGFDLLATEENTSALVIATDLTKSGYYFL
jgi:hypothetical protein